MSVQLCFEKKDLLNITTCLIQTENQIRQQQLQTIDAGNHINLDVSILDEYYTKRLLLIDRNKKNIDWLIKKIDEAKTAGGDVVAVMTITDREK